MLSWKVKTFNEFSIGEWYEVAQLRIEVFVVEQDCPYQELDGKDHLAHHLLGYVDGELQAYSRLFKSGLVAEEASIGRVIVKKSGRRKGYGQALLAESISYIEQEFEDQFILIHAQEYLNNFYQSFGFKPVSKVYLLDGINHLDMCRERSNS